MANFVKEDNKVIILHSPTEKEIDIQDFVDEIKTKVKNCQDVFVVNRTNLQERKWLILYLSIFSIS